MIALERIRNQFQDHVHFEQRLPDTWQLFIPIYHEDGDMVDVFLQEQGGQRIRVSDGGMALMRLSYTYNLHTPARESILRRILDENGVKERDGEIYLDVPTDELYPAVMQLVQVELKVANMELFQRETVASLFYELLAEIVEGPLQQFSPERGYLPIPGRDELEVDYRFPFAKRDVFLFGVKDQSKARLVTIATLQFQKDGIPHRSVVVHEDPNQLTRKDQKLLMNAVDKQFWSLTDFSETGKSYLMREAA